MSEPKKSGIKDAVSSLPRKVVKAEVEQAMGDQEKATVRQTLYLPKPVHDQIREAAFAKRISQQEIFRQALDLWFEHEGLPDWTSLAPTAKE
jgi:hypothetical protein